jgi:glycine/D-amino acid oxidase-like deaminating enzyme
MAQSNSPPRIVICGAGAMGVNLAYFLALQDIPVTIIDRCGVAAGSSGKAGGFLARNWCDGETMTRQSIQ